jgi:hypothetical protein
LGGLKISGLMSRNPAAIWVGSVGMIAILTNYLLWSRLHDRGAKFLFQVGYNRPGARLVDPHGHERGQERKVHPLAMLCKSKRGQKFACLAGKNLLLCYPIAALLDLFNLHCHQQADQTYVCRATFFSTGFVEVIESRAARLIEQVAWQVVAVVNKVEAI